MIVRINDTLTLRNKPSDGAMRSVSNAILLVEKEKAAPETPVEPEIPDTTDPTTPETAPTTPTAPNKPDTVFPGIGTVGIVIGVLVAVTVVLLVVLAICNSKKRKSN